MRRAALLVAIAVALAACSSTPDAAPVGADEDALALSPGCDPACANVACGAAPQCVGGCGPCTGGKACTSAGACVPAPSATPALRIDVATATGNDAACPATSPQEANGHRKCLVTAEWRALNYDKPHLLALGSDDKRGDVWAAGNHMAAYIDDMNEAFRDGADGGNEADRIMAWAKRQFPHGVPDTVLCNEMESTWEMDDDVGARYRAYVVAMATKLDATFHKRAVIATRYATPAAHGGDWAELAAHAKLAVEVQITGVDYVNDPGAARTELARSIAAYAGLGIGKEKLVFLDNYANTVQGSPFGRAGVSADTWAATIRARLAAAASLSLGGYVSYAWANNDAETESDLRIGWERTYAGANVP